MPEQLRHPVFRDRANQKGTPLIGSEEFIKDHSTNMRFFGLICVPIIRIASNSSHAEHAIQTRTVAENEKSPVPVGHGFDPRYSG